jgi:putative ABC transport system substrate-binding protein
LSCKPFVAGFLQGLKEIGFIDGRNVAIEYRWADGQFDRLPGLVGDLVARKVAVILATGGSDPAKAAKAATATIPIVFVSSADPVKAGIVVSINRPCGNITGVSLLGSALEAKRLGLLNEIFPGATPIAVLVNPKYPDVDAQLRELREAAGVIKRQINISNASTAAEIETSFATIVQQGAGSLLVAQDPLRRQDFGRHEAGRVAGVVAEPNSTWSSILKPPGQSASLRQTLCWSPPMR